MTKTKRNSDLDELDGEVNLDVATSLTSRLYRLSEVKIAQEGFSADEEDMER